MFKRMFWSESKARFYGVTWYGYPTTGLGWLNDYHRAARNGLVTGETFAAFVNSLSGETTVLAQSLGNMVVSSALHNPGANIKNYFLINAAVAAEAYDTLSTSDRDPDMVHFHWRNYNDQLWASEWHKLFEDLSDPRRTLSWRGRLANAVRSGIQIINYYSTGDEVLEPHPADRDPGVLDLLGTELFEFRKLWAMQEKAKGHKILGTIGAEFVGGTSYGGWTFNKRYDGIWLPLLGSWHMPPELAYQRFLTSESGKQKLRRHPFFCEQAQSFRGIPDPDGRSLDLIRIGHLLDDQPNGARSELLTEFFPSLTLPAGRRPISLLCPPGASVENINLTGTFTANWPPERDSNQWKHNDVRKVAYPFTHTLFEKIVSDGDLN